MSYSKDRSPTAFSNISASLSNTHLRDSNHSTIAGRYRLEVEPQPANVTYDRRRDVCTFSTSLLLKNDELTLSTR